MPSHAYNHLPPPASTYQTPSKKQQTHSTYQFQNPPAYRYQFQNRKQQTPTSQSPSPNHQKPLPPIPITYSLTPQYTLWSNHILALYHHDSHEKYYRWSEEDIAVDLAYRSFIDGVFMDGVSDVETHAVEICLVLVDREVWSFCGTRIERVRGMVGGSM